MKIQRVGARAIRKMVVIRRAGAEVTQKMVKIKREQAPRLYGEL